MKEHGLFLEAGFTCVNEMILNSRELVTEFTIAAEKRTELLSVVPIDSSITAREQNCVLISDRMSAGKFWKQSMR